MVQIDREHVERNLQKAFERPVKEEPLKDNVLIEVELQAAARNGLTPERIAELLKQKQS
jgi:hypothetical protein